MRDHGIRILRVHADDGADAGGRVSGAIFCSRILESLDELGWRVGPGEVEENPEIFGKRLVRFGEGEAQLRREQDGFGPELAQDEIRRQLAGLQRPVEGGVSLEKGKPEPEYEGGCGGEGFVDEDAVARKENQGAVDLIHGREEIEVGERNQLAGDFIPVGHRFGIPVHLVESELADGQEGWQESLTQADAQFAQEAEPADALPQVDPAGRKGSLVEERAGREDRGYAVLFEKGIPFRGVAKEGQRQVDRDPAGEDRGKVKEGRHGSRREKDPDAVIVSIGFRTPGMCDGESGAERLAMGERAQVAAEVDKEFGVAMLAEAADGGGGEGGAEVVALGKGFDGEILEKGAGLASVDLIRRDRAAEVHGYRIGKAAGHLVEIPEPVEREDRSPERIHVDRDYRTSGLADDQFESFLKLVEHAGARELSLGEDADHVPLLERVRRGANGVLGPAGGNGDDIEEPEEPGKGSDPEKMIDDDEPHRSGAGHGENEGVHVADVIADEEDAARGRDEIVVEGFDAINEAGEQGAEEPEQVTGQELGDEAGDSEETGAEPRGLRGWFRRGSVFLR